jgi:hypothetical protein
VIRPIAIEPALHDSWWSRGWSRSAVDDVTGTNWTGISASETRRCYPRNYPRCVDYPSVVCEVQAATIGTAVTSADLQDSGDMDPKDFAQCLQGIRFLPRARPRERKGK